MTRAQECNFDSLVGLTHNYAGLAYGNVASADHQNETSYPRQAALQGLEKMRQVASMGIPQAVLPPLVRPDLSWLRDLGFTGSAGQVIRQAFETDPVLYAAACSASSMWAANAATVSPSADCGDQRVHFTIANLNSSLHRSLEAQRLEVVFRQLFAAPAFRVHSALPAGVGLTDEGAANHTRLCREYGQPGIELFVYGRDALDLRQPVPRRFPARQTRQASEAIGRRHQLDPAACCFLQQSPEAIDAGVFHNDVISVGNRDLLLVHQFAYLDQESELERLQRQFEHRTGQALQLLTVSDRELSLEQAVKSYLFNSQLVSLSDDRMALVCPVECREQAQARDVIERWIAGDNPISEVHFLDLRQSMNNGGGPACLRLRVVLEPTQRQAVQGRIWLDQALHDELVEWIQEYYPESLTVDQLADESLWSLSRRANQQLSRILQLSLPDPSGTDV